MIMNKEIFEKEVNLLLESNGEEKVTFGKYDYPESILLGSDEIIIEAVEILEKLDVDEIMTHTICNEENINYILLENQDKIVALAVMDEYGEVIIFE